MSNFRRNYQQDKSHKFQVQVGPLNKKMREDRSYWTALTRLKTYIIKHMHDQQVSKISSTQGIRVLGSQNQIVENEL